MPTVSHMDEAERASIAYQVALTQIGAATVEDALRLWSGVPPTATATQSARWLGQAVHLIMTRRGLARDLAMAYYRLVRALRTGRTVPDPRRPEPPYVTLDMLRREFALLAGPTLQEGENPQPDSEDVQADRIYLEQIKGFDDDEARLQREAEYEARIQLDQLGSRNLRKKVAQLDNSRPATDVDASREEAHRQAGARQAAAAERIVRNGARGTTWTLADRDRRVIGYVRYSKTGTPCGWCAMLLSRGLVAKYVYRSADSALYSEGDLYHDNCQCDVEAIYSTAQYESSPRFDLNREYGHLWPTVTKGLSGKAALSAWRAFIRKQALAQVASSNN